MIVALIISCATVAAAVVGIVTLALALRGVYRDLAIDHDALLAEQRRGDDLQDQRDSARAYSTRIELELAEVQRRLTEAETQRNAATAKEADHAASTVRDADDALGAFNDVLQGTVVSPASEADTARTRRAAADATPSVLVADDAGTGGTGGAK